MILKHGSKGSQVAELQRLLKLADDGIFGDDTKEAVIKFQKSKGLKVDGIVGSKTWGKLLSNNRVDNIKPIYTQTSTEDLSDPEEEMKVDNVQESLPTSSFVVELISLINNSRITRKINKLVFHCTATQQDASVSSIQKYWKEKLGWRSPGYHIIVKPDGSWTQLLDFNNVSNGVAGINSTSIHISYIGGVDSNGKASDNRTQEQKDIFESVYLSFKEKMPTLTFHGHYEFSNKACPSFNVKNWLGSIV